MEDIDNFIKNLSIIPRDVKEQFEYIANFFQFNILNYFRNETKLKYEEIEQPIQFDFFLICYKDTIRERDLKIARQIRKDKHKSPHFFLVRTHMDKAVEDKEGILGRILTKKDEEDLFKEIRDNANKCLVVQELSKDVDDDRYLFLLSALLRKVENKITDNRNKFDFERLQFEILNKLKGEKKRVNVNVLFSLKITVSNGSNNIGRLSKLTNIENLQTNIQ